MAASPRFKVHNPQGQYIASCKHLEDAAAIIAAYGDGAYILDRPTNVRCWLEGSERQRASESFDFVYETGWARMASAVRTVSESVIVNDHY